MSAGTISSTPLPVTTLPPEILSEIFLLHLSLPPFPGQAITHHYQRNRTLAPSTIPDDPCTLYSPVTLGLVCRLWRAITLHTPTLWTTIVLQNPMPGHLRIFALWLTRSGTSLPLHLTFFDMPNAFWGAHVVPIMRMAVASSERWASLRVQSHGGSRLNPKCLIELLQPANPISLLKFDLSLVGNGEPATKVLLPFLAAKSPNLEEMVVYIPFHHYQTMSSVPGKDDIAHVKRIHLKQVALDRAMFPFFASLESSGVLTSLKVDFQAWGMYRPGAGARIYLPSLLELSLSDLEGSVHLKPFLDACVMPSLQTFAIAVLAVVRGNSQSIWEDTVPQFLRRSGCDALRSLSISGIHSRWGNDVEKVVIRLFSMPVLQESLSTLALSGSVSNHTLRALTVSPRSAIILPKLRSLTLLDCNTSSGMVCALLRSRSSIPSLNNLPDGGAIARLESLAVEFSSPRALRREREMLWKDVDCHGVYVRFGLFEDWMGVSSSRSNSWTGSPILRAFR